MWKKKILPFLKRYYPFLLIVPLVLLAVFFVLSIFARNVVVDPNGNPFPEGSTYANDQIIVKYKEGNSPEELIERGKNDQEAFLNEQLKSLGIDSQEKLFSSVDEFLKNYYLLYLRPGTNIPQLYKQLSGIPEIDSVTPDYILNTRPNEEEKDVPTVQSPPLTQEEPNDPYFIDGQQWDMTTIDMKKAWDIKRAGEDIVVAVIDTGVDYNHPDLIGRVIKGKNYINNSDDPLDDHGHGTHVAGTIGAITNNGIGVSSASWGAKILAIKACDSNGDCVTSNVVRGVSYALDQGVKIINISIAGIGSCRKENFFSGDKVYDDVIRDAKSKGALIVVAAGNHNQDAMKEVPGACEGVFNVAATNMSNTRWISSNTSGSNFGSKIDISAPGSPILSTSTQNAYSVRNGTSMAAPHVSGVAALLLSFNKNLSPDNIKKCIVDSAVPLQTDERIGGLLNAYEALLSCGASQPQNISALNPTQAFTPVPTSSSIIEPDSDTSESYTVSGTVFIDTNNNGIFDSAEKTLGGVQVILSPADTFTSVLTNPRGFYLFNNLTANNYLLSLTIPGVSSVNLPTRSITLGNTIKSAVVNMPVSPLALPTPTILPTVTQSSTGEPLTDQPTSGCYYDLSCFGNKQSVQACSFTCY